MDATQVNIEEAIRSASTERRNLQEQLQAIFLEELGLLKTSEDADFDPGYNAWGLAGVDVAIRLAHMFIGLKRNTGMHEALCDLTYQLNANSFWQKNASVIVPLVHAALNTHRDGALLLADRAIRNEYSSSDALICTSRAFPLEIFPVIAYLIGGPQLMAAKSLILKQRLSPYFL